MGDAADFEDMYGSEPSFGIEFDYANVPPLEGKAASYRAWENMRAKCQNQRDPRYPRYGGRGITVCDRWENFSNFYDDMGDKPFGMKLVRKNFRLGYFPDNVEWGTRIEYIPRNIPTECPGCNTSLNLGNMAKAKRGVKCSACYESERQKEQLRIRAIRENNKHPMTFDEYTRLRNLNIVRTVDRRDNKFNSVLHHDARFVN
ncbi:hypothetical protein [Streptomyces scabiei]|uniref:hypothetical protein n=1 Tax=Streptomyces scabiei TaxID=1930 RepID=UPI0029BB5A54|nr:hypothetical protein [Streptomyces scabiei]MDX2689293.1 hypothetical protein [Streptomyces scabiei]